MKDKIYFWWEQATEKDLNEGLFWYSDAMKIVSAVKEICSFSATYEQVAGTVALFSIQKSWKLNVDLALHWARTGEIRHLGFVKDRINLILKTNDPEEIGQIVKGKNGRKIEAFYRAFCGDFQSVVIDRHILSIFGKTKATEAQYGQISDAFTEVAEELEMFPARLQAVVWCAYRRAEGKEKWGANTLNN